jgi:hypothetical protein
VTYLAIFTSQHHEEFLKKFWKVREEADVGDGI